MFLTINTIKECHGDSHAHGGNTHREHRHGSVSCDTMCEPPTKQ